VGYGIQNVVNGAVKFLDYKYWGHHTHYNCGFDGTYTWSYGEHDNCYPRALFAGCVDNYITYNFGLRPIVFVNLDSNELNLTGSGSSGNPYTLVKK